jgi:hypothetical protein
MNESMNRLQDPVCSLDQLINPTVHVSMKILG